MRDDMKPNTKKKLSHLVFFSVAIMMFGACSKRPVASVGGGDASVDAAVTVPKPGMPSLAILDANGHPVAGTEKANIQPFVFIEPAPQRPTRIYTGVK